MKITDKIQFGLTDDECKVLEYWKVSRDKRDAYQKVFFKRDKIRRLSSAALHMRIKRFFQTDAMKRAIEFYELDEANKRSLCYDENTAVGRFLNKKKEEEEKAKEEKNKIDSDSKEESNNEEPQKEEIKEEKKIEEQKKEEPRKKRVKEVEPEIIKTVQEKWLDSLKVSENPSAFTVYGTGQFIIYNAVQEMMNRKAYIKQNNISPMSKDGSMFTSGIISALKTGASMILPYAPTPSLDDRKEMSKAAVLLGLLPDNIVECPDDFTAPIPATAEVVESED
jgi:hypothetical protein